MDMDSEDCEVRIMSDFDRVKMWAATMKSNHNTAEDLLCHGFDTMEAISMIEVIFQRLEFRLDSK